MPLLQLLVRERYLKASVMSTSSDGAACQHVQNKPLLKPLPDHNVAYARARVIAAVWKGIKKKGESFLHMLQATHVHSACGYLIYEVGEAVCRDGTTSQATAWQASFLDRPRRFWAL